MKAPLNIPLVDIGELQCRWVTSEERESPTFCGHPTGKGSWCPEHRAIVFNTVPKQAVAHELA